MPLLSDADSPLWLQSGLLGQLPAPPAQLPALSQPNLLDRLGGGLAGNSNLLLGLGAGLWSGGLGRGLAGAMIGGALDRKRQAASLRQASAIAALKAHGVSDADALAAGLNSELLKSIVRSKIYESLLRQAPEGARAIIGGERKLKKNGEWVADDAAQTSEDGSENPANSE